VPLPSTDQTTSQKLPNLADLSRLFFISEIPMIIDNSEAFDGKSCHHFNDQQTFEKIIPESTSTSKERITVKTYTRK